MNCNKKSLLKKRAFTLIELLIVIAIIGILFVVLVSRVDFATDKAKTTGVQADFRSFQMAGQSIAAEQGCFTTNLEEFADLLNRNLDSELSVIVNGDKLETSTKDPWGNTYIATLTQPENTRGEITFVSAGPDMQYYTNDDQALTLICNNLGHLEVVNPLQKPHQHQFEAIESGNALKTAGTCISKATYYYSCRECNIKSMDTFTAGTTNPNNHVRLDKIYSDNFDGSHTIDTKCLDCDSIIDSVKQSHNAGSGMNCPDCGSDVGHVHTYDQTLKTNQTLVSASSCTEPAKYYYSCTCGDIGSTTFTDGTSIGHDMINHIDEKYLKIVATCTELATYYKSCSRCGAIDSTTFVGGELAPHNYNQEKIDNLNIARQPSCTESATYYKTCVCGARGTETFDSNIKLPHTYGELTCGTPQSCLICGYNNGVTGGHQSINGGTALVHTKCGICDTTLSSDHGPYTSTILTDSTCQSVGSILYSCSCGYSYMAELAINPQNHIGDILIENGTETVHSSYSGCGCVVSTQHEFDEIITQDSTCTTKGLKTFSCDCGYSYTEEISQKTHSFTEKVIDDQYKFSNATCTSPAKYYYSCKNCQAAGTSTFTYGDVVHVPDTPGYEQLTCRGDVYCTLCNKKLADVTHNTVDYHCIECGDYVPGLYDSNGKLVLTWNSMQVQYKPTLGSNTSSSYHMKNILNNSKLSAVKSVAFPESLESIPEGSFRTCKQLTEVYIPSTIKTIEKTAFYECTALTSIKFANDSTLETIGESAFSKTSSLGKLVLPQSIVSIEASAFYTSGVDEVYFGTNLKSIGRNCFYQCSSLTAIYFDKNSHLEVIDQLAFNGCTQLTTVHLNDVDTLLWRCFYDCNNITEFKIGVVKSCDIQSFDTMSNLQTIQYNDFCYLGNDENPYAFLFSPIPREEQTRNEIIHPDTKFIKSAQCTTPILKIPEGVVGIGNMAFWNDNEIIRVELPSTLENVDIEAFGACYGLKNFYVHEDNPYLCAIDGVLYTKDLKRLIDYPKNAQRTTFVMPEGVEVISANAFDSVISLETIYIADTVKTIETYAFTSCFDVLKNVIISENSQLETLGMRVFEDPWNPCPLMEITLPATLKSVGYIAFEGWRVDAKVRYMGTMQQWFLIWERQSDAQDGFSGNLREVICTDGIIRYDSNGELIIE